MTFDNTHFSLLFDNAQHPDKHVTKSTVVGLPGKWQEGRPRWVELLQQDRIAHEVMGALHAEAVDLCLEAARMARDAGVEGAMRAEQHWLPHGTMQVCGSLGIFSRSFSSVSRNPRLLPTVPCVL